MIAMTQPWGYFICNFVTAISQIILDNEQLCLISYFLFASGSDSWHYVIFYLRKNILCNHIDQMCNLSV